MLTYGSKECGGPRQGIILTSSQQVPYRVGRAGEGREEKLEEERRSGGK